MVVLPARAFGHRHEDRLYPPPGLEAEDGQDGVRGVEVDVGQHVRHDVVDHVFEPRNPVHKQGHSLRGDT